jgi:hypothetical protein
MRRSIRSAAKVRQQEEAAKALAQAKAVLHRFTAPAEERARLDRPRAITDPHSLDAIAVQLAASTMKGPGNLAFWVRSAEKRGAFAAVRNPGASDGAFVLFVDGQAMAQLAEQLARFDRIQAEAAQVRQLKGEA